MSRSFRLRAFVTCLAAASAGGGAWAASLPQGFYGGLSIRENGAEQGVTIGGTSGNASRFGSALLVPATSQAFAFGGYRWRNDLAVEAALGSANGYRLPGRGGVGLALPPGNDDGARAWNLDVYGSWSFARRFSLFGRLGYSQLEAAPLASAFASGTTIDRQRDGLSYGVGLRYDVNRSLGLKLEYARIGSYAADPGSLAHPEGDQVQFGLQFRF